LSEWTTATFRVDSALAVALGIDGESVAMEPPLVFESDPRALRVVVPRRRSRRQKGRPALPGVRP
jgi:diacylglycerol kinase family enzyme